MTAAKYRSALFAGGRGRPPLPVLPKVRTGIADLPTAARRSLPRDLSSTLEMTGLNTVPLGWRRDEGVPPYRGEIRCQKRYSATLRISPDYLTTTTVFDL